MQGRYVLLRGFSVLTIFGMTLYSRAAEHKIKALKRAATSELVAKRPHKQQVTSKGQSIHSKKHVVSDLVKFVQGNKENECAQISVQDPLQRALSAEEWATSVAGKRAIITAINAWKCCVDPVNWKNKALCPDKRGYSVLWFQNAAQKNDFLRQRQELQRQELQHKQDLQNISRLDEMIAQARQKNERIAAQRALQNTRLVDMPLY